MARSKTGTTRTNKHKKILKANKGYWGSRSKLIRRAKEAFIRAGEHAFFGRRLRKRDMRQLWITRLSAVLRSNDLSYSAFIGKLSKNKINLNRKMLSELAIFDSETFTKIVDKVK